MRRRRAPYANRSVWYAVGILALVVVLGFAGVGYELNHLRTQVNSLNGRINSLNQTITEIEVYIRQLFAQVK